MANFTEHLALKCRLEMCITVLNEYSWLLDAYVLDFFTENHMNKLSNSWNNSVKNIPVEEFYYLMNLSAKTQNIWPLSTLCLRILIQFLQFPRKLISHDSISTLQSNKIDIKDNFNLNNIKFSCFEHSKLNDYILKHVKPKKRYEILKMATFTAKIANELNVKYVIDVGSGLGHLSRIMAYGFNLNVCSIETQNQLIKQARVIDDEFISICKKYLNEIEFERIKSKKPAHVNQTIRFDLTVNVFLQHITEAFSISKKNFRFGIVGLHSCGDLAAVLLRLYTDCSEAKFINLVGCCYHKLSTSRNSQNNIGFPLSNFCSQTHINISHEAKALACHAIENYSKRLISKGYDHLKVHCYRAALEKIIDKNWPQHRKSALANVKFTPGLTFTKYCQSALKKLNLCISEEDLRSEETLKNLLNWEDVVKFYSLRLMLAPAIETVILLDRKLFLIEKGFKCKIKAAFDPEISPRNQLLISQKGYCRSNQFQDVKNMTFQTANANTNNHKLHIFKQSRSAGEKKGTNDAENKNQSYQKSETNLRKNFDLVTKNLNNLLKKTNNRVTVQKYKNLLGKSIEESFRQSQEELKKTKNLGSQSNSLLIQVAIITKKNASVVADILSDVINKLEKTILNTTSVNTFKIVQVSAEQREKPYGTSDKNTLINWVLCSDNVYDLSRFFKEWLLNPQRQLQILLSKDLGLEVKCDVDDFVISLDFFDDMRSKGILKEVHQLEIINRLPVGGLCPTLVFGTPRCIYPTTFCNSNWTELQINKKIFKELCRELNRTGQGLLAKSVLPIDCSKIITFHFLTSSSSDVLLMNDVAPHELYFPKRVEYFDGMDACEDDSAASVVKSCLQKIKFLSEYTLHSFSSGVYEYLRDSQTKAVQNKGLFGRFNPNVKLFGKNLAKKRNSMLPLDFNDNSEYTVKNERNKKAKPDAKELQNVHPALLAPNIVQKYRKNSL